MTDKRVIPQELKQYESEILAGLAMIERRRSERAQAWARPTLPVVPGPVVFAQLQQPAAIEPQQVSLPPEEIPHLAAIEPKPQRAADQSVKFWPLVGIAAARDNAGGAWRAWVLAKNLDKPGRGAIQLADLQALARALGIHPKTWRRWLSAARDLALIKDRARGDGWIVLASNPRAAVLLGCDHAGVRPVSIAAGDLTSEGWRARVFAAYEHTHNGRPISRVKQERLTGVPISTQRAYDNQAGVTRRPNYAVSQRAADQLAGELEFGEHAAPFVFRDRQGREVIAWRLPDSRISHAAESLQRGRSRKINKAIKQNAQRLNDSSIPGRVQSFDAGGGLSLRLFHRTSKQAKSTERKLAHSDYRPPGEIYVHKSETRRVDLWRVLPQGGGLPA